LRRRHRRREFLQATTGGQQADACFNETHITFQAEYGMRGMHLELAAAA
jgi:hypothetical protein